MADPQKFFLNCLFGNFWLLMCALGGTPKCSVCKCAYKYSHPQSLRIKPNQPANQLLFSFPRSFAPPPQNILAMQLDNKIGLKGVDACLLLLVGLLIA